MNFYFNDKLDKILMYLPFLAEEVGWEEGREAVVPSILSIGLDN